MKELEGKVAVITGGAAGIGRAIALRFASEGMKLVLADIEQPVLDATVKELRERKAPAIGVPTDVSDYESVVALREAALAEFGQVDVLLNNAGVGSGGQGRAWQHDLNDWNWCLAVNVMGVVHGQNAFLDAMIAQGTEGHVINTSSHNGGFFPLPNTAIYSATKAAVVTLTEIVWAQLRELDAKISASVLFPAGRTPGILNTGIWNSGRNRPARWTPATPQPTPAVSPMEAYVKAAEAAGRPVGFADLAEIADQVVDALRADRFWIHPPSEEHDAAIRERTASIIARGRPSYMLERLDPPRSE